MKTLIVSMVAVLSLFLTACGGSDNDGPATLADAQTQSATPDAEISDEVYVQVITDEIPEFAEFSDSLIIDLGNQICEDLKGEEINMANIIAYAGGLKDGSGFLTDGESGFLIGASTAAYCPDIGQEILALDSGTQFS